MVTLLVRSFLTQRLPRSLPARRAQPPTATHPPWGRERHGPWHVPVASWLPEPLPSFLSLPAEQLHPRYACGAPAQAPARCCLLSWGTVAGVGSGVTGPCVWASTVHPPEAFSAPLLARTLIFFFFSSFLVLRSLHFYPAFVSAWKLLKWLLNNPSKSPPLFNLIPKGLTLHG